MMNRLTNEPNSNSAWREGSSECLARHILLNHSPILSIFGGDLFRAHSDVDAILRDYLPLGLGDARFKLHGDSLGGTELEMEFSLEYLWLRRGCDSYPIDRLGLLLELSVQRDPTENDALDIEAIRGA